MIAALFLAAALPAFHGKVVIVNFWATWCGGCKVEMPQLAKLDDTYRAKGLQIIGVSMDDADDDVVARFVKSKNVHYTIVRGDEALAKKYGVQAMPKTVVFDRNGKIVEMFTGVPDAKEFEAAVARLLGDGH